jgi:hypothetical protein
MDETVVEQKYVDYIESLIEGIVPLLPEDVNKLQQDYLENNIRHSALLLASSMQTDTVFQRLTFEQQCVYIQIMAEWSFHKEIDLFRSGIPAKYWKIVMQKIWYTIWEVMYACIQNEAPENIVLDIVKRYVNRTYNDAVEELKDTNIIDDETEEKAKEQSNIEIMAQEYNAKLKFRKIKRIFNYAILFAVIAATITFLVLKYQTVGIIIVLTFLAIYTLVPFVRN